jgi:hypothetical protein
VGLTGPFVRFSSAQVASICWEVLDTRKRAVFDVFLGAEIEILGPDWSVR